MDRKVYDESRQKYYNKITNKFKKDLENDIKDWDLETLKKAYIDIQIARLMIAPYPPYDWFEIFDDNSEVL